MVPDGWRIGVLSDIADTVMGYAFKSSDFVENGLPLLRMGNLYQNTLDLHRNPVYLPEQFKKDHSKFLIVPGDLVMSMTGTMGKRDYGFTVKIPKDAPDSLLNQRVMKFIPKQDTSSGYLLNLLLSELVLSTLYSFPGGTKQANLSAKQVKELPALIPPLPEQKKIAKILQTWDRAIATTEKLIDASKQQKKALMQQLLTGKKRFAGFEGEWEEERFSDIVVSTQLGTTERTKESNDTECIHLIKMGNLTWGGISLKKVETIPMKKVDSAMLLRTGDFLFNTRNTPELVGKSAIWNDQLKEATFDNNINKITFNKSVNPEYLCFYLTYGKGKSLIQALPAGSTSVAAIYWKDLKGIRLILPTIKEQNIIASVLKITEKEINLLKSKLGDLKQEKKALMQQLLTGKRRVKADE